MSTARTPRVINKQLFIYATASFFTAMVMNFKEFGTAVIIGNLLGGTQMAIVNMALPFCLWQVFISTIIGLGGATLYGDCIGRRDTSGAKVVFSASVFGLFCISIIFVFVSVLFSEQIAHLLLNGNAKILPELNRLIRGIAFNTPVFVIIPAMGYFLRCDGKPGFAIFFTALANISALVSVVVLIKGFGFDYMAQPASTLVGFAATVMVYAGFILAKKIDFPLSLKIMINAGTLKKIMRFGAPTALSSVLLSFQVAVLNALSLKTGGLDGVVLFAVCLGANAVIAAVMGAVNQALPPMLSVLKGARDIVGQRFLLLKIYGTQLVLGIAMTVLFTLFPQLVLDLYKVNPNLYELGEKAVGIYSAGMCLSMIMLTGIAHLQTLGHTKTALFMGVVKNVALVIPLSVILSGYLGFIGIMWGFLISGVLGVFILNMCNMFLARRSQSQLKGIFMLPTDDMHALKYEGSIAFDKSAAVSLSKEILSFCLNSGLDENMSNKVALLVREMAVFTIDNQKLYLKSDSIDVLIRITPQGAEINFRSVGEPFNVTAVNKDNLLHNAADEISFERMLSMNNTIIKINTIRGPHNEKVIT